MKRLPSPTALRIFVEASRASSFARAAEVLNITQPAVSKQIASLEDRIGSKLFERQHRSIALTLSGEAYLPYAKHVLELLEDGDIQASAHSGQENLSVVIDHELLNFVISPRLNKLRQALPNINLAFLPEPGRRITPNCDLAITFGHPSDRAFQSERLCTFRAFAVGTPDLLESCENPLKDLPLIHDVETYWWEAILAAEGVQRSTRGIVMGSGAAAIRAASFGTGLAIGDSLLCADALSSGALIRASNSTLPARVDYWLSARKTSKKSNAALLFEAWLREELQQLLRTE